MRKNKTFNRLLSLVLVAAMLVGLSFPINGASEKWTKLSWSQTDINPDPRNPEKIERNENAVNFADDELVRVSIVLDGEATTDNFSTVDIATNEDAIAYRNDLQDKQDALTVKIEKEVLAGETLDVEWNLTLVANMISANVEYGKIEKIKALDGVKDVVLEVKYAPAVAEEDMPLDPQMSTSSAQIGSGVAYAEGYTGAGSKVAIIDTGIDLDHKSFNADAFLHAIEEVIDGGKDVDLMDASDIDAVLDQLNIVKLGDYTRSDASALYQNAKVPFAFNYVDGDLDVTHDNDTQGEHGSHVTGIAAANRYIKNGSDYEDALTSVLTQGVAPDAQVLTMKVFGKGGGAYDSDYMAAIEDAIVLGADSVNLSLGSSMAGFSRSDAYESVMNSLVESDTVVTMSAGNNGIWSENSQVPYPYGDDINFQSGGSPGSFKNSLSVASVDNAGSTGDYVAVGGNLIFYTETTGYRNTALTTLAGEHDYIIIDGIGDPSEFEALGDLVNGKVVLVYRGDISFYVKGENAVDAGAIATIIVNNQPGTISMDLSDYSKTQPCVSITQEDGEYFWANGTEATLNGITYATGTMTVGNQVGSSGAEKSEDGTYQMSSFSSWGIPGSLIMKPEITAPGGNIYSVNGAVAGGEAYENMSGTSMAAPQVTGMAAVVAQYIRDNADRFADVELTQRALINSLLMATAEPIIEPDTGYYYSVLAQGSGLANVGNAVSADSYIVMSEGTNSGAADGKVKVELGDDPAKEGVYTYNFTIHNTSGHENVYTFNTELFTQDLFTDSGLTFLDTWTTPISSVATYTVNGGSFDTEARIDADVKADGYTDNADAQAILEYLVGSISDEGLDLEAADVDGDGAVTTYDAHLILEGVEERLAVPAESAVEVTVTVTVTEDLSKYENGAYIEGYTFVLPVASEDGELDVTYSIPVLGFYGNWSDASMFDRVTLENYFYDNGVPYSYTGEVTDELDYTEGKNGYYLLGNPYAQDEEYHPEREALSSNATLDAYYYTLIRNAGARFAAIYDADGNVVFTTPVSSEYAAFYYTSGGTWQYTSSKVGLGVKVGNLNTAENEAFTFEMYAIPEYYLTDEMYEDGQLTVDELLPIVDQLGHGAVVSKTITVDNTAPELIGDPLKSANGDLKVTVKDNQYIAYAQVLTRSGTVFYAEVTADEIGQTATGQQIELTFSGEDLANAGEYVAVAVYDYAGNANIIEVKYGEPKDVTGVMYGFTNELFSLNDEPVNTWIEIDPEYVDLWDYDQGYALSDASNVYVVAAEYIDGYSFQVGDDNVLYIAPVAEPGYISRVASLPIAPVDMAYDYSRNVLYALAGTSVYAIDPLTGATTLAFTVTGASALTGMAVDNDGTFYFAGASALYTVAGWDGSSRVAAKNVGSLAALDDVSVLTWDRNTDTLYLVGGEDYLGLGIINIYYLYSVDTATGAYEPANEYGASLFANFTAIYVVPADKGDSNIDTTPTDTVANVTVAPASKSVMVGGTYQLTADVTPYNLSNKNVTWTSSDTAVATVDEDGNVIAVGEGNATITATSVLDSTKSATSTVEVLSLPSFELKGLVYDDDSVAYWSSFNAQKPADFNHLAQGNYYYAGALAYDGTIYTHDGENVYAVDPTTFSTELLFSINPTYLFPDAAANAYFANYSAGETALLAPKANSGVLMIFLPQSANLYTVDLSSQLSANIAGITWTGLASGTSAATCYDYYFMVLENGDLYLVRLSGSGSLGYALMGNIGMDLTGAANPDGGSSVSMIYDWDNYDEDTGNEYVYIAHYADGDDSAILSVVQVGDDVNTMASISFGDNVWPVVSLYSYFEESVFVESSDATERSADVNFIETSVDLSDLKSAVAVEETNSNANALVGSLNAVSAAVEGKEDKNAQKYVIDTEANTITVKVDVSASTNGLVDVAFDADVLTVESVNGLTKYFAHNEEEGVVTFGYAAAGALNGKVSEIVFTYDEKDEASLKTDITVTIKEDGADLDVNTDEVVKVDLVGAADDTNKTPEEVDTPQMGDTAVIVFWMFMTVVGLVGVSFAVVMLPRKRYGFRR